MEKEECALRALEVFRVQSTFRLPRELCGFNLQGTSQAVPRVNNIFRTEHTAIYFCMEGNSIGVLIAISTELQSMKLARSSKHPI